MALILLSSVSLVEAYKFNKPVIFIDNIIPSRMSDQYIVFISICSPKILRYPSLEVSSDLDSFDLQYQKIISKNKCTSFNLTIQADNPDSIIAKLT